MNYISMRLYKNTTVNSHKRSNRIIAHGFTVGLLEIIWKLSQHSKCVGLEQAGTGLQPQLLHCQPCACGQATYFSCLSPAVLSTKYRHHPPCRVEVTPKICITAQYYHHFWILSYKKNVIQRSLYKYPFLRFYPEK